MCVDNEPTSATQLVKGPLHRDADRAAVNCLSPRVSCGCKLGWLAVWRRVINFILLPLFNLTFDSRIEFIHE